MLNRELLNFDPEPKTVCQAHPQRLRLVVEVTRKVKALRRDMVFGEQFRQEVVSVVP